LDAVTSTFPANWPEDLRLRYDKAIPASEKKGQWGRFEPGRLEHYATLHEIYKSAGEKMQAADGAFQEKKVAAVKKGIIGAGDVPWISKILDGHREYWQHNLLPEKNYALMVLWLKEHGETAEFEKEKMKAFWKEREMKTMAAAAAAPVKRPEKTAQK